MIRVSWAAMYRILDASMQMTRVGVARLDCRRLWLIKLDKILCYTYPVVLLCVCSSSVKIDPK